MGIDCSWLRIRAEEKPTGNSPSPGIANPKVTPASERMLAADLVKGGPTRVFCFSQVSGAPRLAVRITGTLASASSAAT